jgi:hypothetical protein
LTDSPTSTATYIMACHESNAYILYELRHRYLNRTSSSLRTSTWKPNLQQFNFHHGLIPNVSPCLCPHFQLVPLLIATGSEVTKMSLFALMSNMIPLLVTQTQPVPNAPKSTTSLKKGLQRELQ